MGLTMHREHLMRTPLLELSMMINYEVRRQPTQYSDF
jgi:hypothetical protein